ncbi:MAG TPA: Gfo/Idh/MocA family oxidoreductase [Chthonomonadaceae bacterium]|nr:Gfo/Idh/MocA family oxidoreductase [Chthonomonadaceae bacterium]
MAEKEVRIGVVGTGGMGQAHIRRLAEIPQARLVALCDWDEQKVRSVAEPLGAAVYTDGAKMIANADLDALYICVPPHTHEDLEIRAAEKGLHLYVEKPVNLYIDRARKAWEAIRKAGVMSQVGYQLRYQPNVQQLRAFLADKMVGTAHVYRWSGTPEKDWWHRYDQGGGQLVEMTTHQVDILRWVMGEIEAVAAGYSFDRLFRGQPGLTVPDSQAVLLRFASGASATLNTSCAAGKGWKGDTEFVIKDGRVSLQSDGVKVEPEGSYPIPPLPTETMSADEAFVRAVATGNRDLLLSPYDDGLKSCAVTLAANLSAENGGRLVKVEEVLGPLA